MDAAGGHHREVRANTQTLRTLLKSYILTTYGAAALQMLGDFGMTVPKNRGQKTAEAKAQAQAKALATRKAKKAALASVTSKPAATPAASVSTTPAHS